MFVYFSKSLYVLDKSEPWACRQNATEIHEYLYSHCVSNPANCTTVVLIGRGGGLFQRHYSAVSTFSVEELCAIYWVTLMIKCLCSNNFV